jgi:hypothetical protein
MPAAFSAAKDRSHLPSISLLQSGIAPGPQPGDAAPTNTSKERRAMRQACETTAPAMARHVFVLYCSALFAAGSAAAQTPPPLPESQPGRVFCEQSVSYRIADPAGVPEPYRAFLGAWSDAAWDADTCAALIVDDVRPDGTASVIYVHGPLGSTARVPGGVLHGSGIIKDSELRFQNSDGTQFSFRPTISDLIGQMTTPSGQTYQAGFKKTF